MSPTRHSSRGSWWRKLLAVRSQSSIGIPSTSEITRVGGGTILSDMKSIQAEHRPSAITLQELEDMSADPQIAAGMALIKMPIAAVDYTIACENPDEKEIPAFVNQCIRKIWQPFIRNALTALDFGFSAQEKRWKQDSDGRWVWRTFLSLHPKDVELLRKGNDFFGFRQRSRSGQEPVPAEKSFLFVNDMKFGNLYGTPRTWGAYNPWWLYKHLRRFAAVYFEKTASPLLEGRAPAQALVYKADGTTDQIDGMAKLYNEVLAKLGADTNKYVLDSTRNEQGQFLWDVILKELSPGHGLSYIRFMSYLDVMKTRGMFVPDLTMFQLSDVGSRAMSQSHGEIYWALQAGLLGDLKGYIDLYLIDQLVRYNFGEDAPACFWEYQPLSPDTIEWLKRLVDRMVQSSVVLPDLQELESRLGIRLTQVMPAKQARTVERGADNGQDGEEGSEEEEEEGEGGGTLEQSHPKVVTPKWAESSFRAELTRGGLLW